MRDNIKKIGVLGGMGPESTADFYKKIIEISQNKYSAVQDTDYPEMIIYSLPLVGFDETGIVDREAVLKQLVLGIKLLNKAGADFIIMPCNTVHYFIEKLRKISKVPILSIIEETAKKIKSDNISSVALLASETTYKLKIYDSALKKEKISFTLPNENQKKQLTSLILKVMAGKSGNGERQEFCLVFAQQKI